MDWRRRANRLAGQAVEASHQLILLGSVLVLLSIFAGVFSARLGAPLLLIFLGLGMLAGEGGLGGIVFRDFHAAYLIGSISLPIILFDGGLRTDRGAIRRALWPSLALATVGVIAAYRVNPNAPARVWRPTCAGHLIQFDGQREVSPRHRQLVRPRSDQQASSVLGRSDVIAAEMNQVVDLIVG